MPSLLPAADRVPVYAAFAALPERHVHAEQVLSSLLTITPGVGDASVPAFSYRIVSNQALGAGTASQNYTNLPGAGLSLAPPT
jgi:hypothetical protein